MANSQRCHSVKPYLEKVRFYVTCVRYLRTGLRPLEIANPDDAGAAPLTVDDLCQERKGKKTSTWLSRWVLFYLRALEYPGKRVNGGPTRAQADGFLCRRLGIDAAAVAGRTGPGEAEFFRGMRYQVGERARRMGRCIREKGLVAKDQNDVWVWDPAAACFNDWSWKPEESCVGSFPAPGGPNWWPHAPPLGFLKAHAASGTMPPAAVLSGGAAVTNAPAPIPMALTTSEEISGDAAEDEDEDDVMEDVE